MLLVKMKVIMMENFNQKLEGNFSGYCRSVSKDVKGGLYVIIYDSVY